MPSFAIPSEVRAVSARTHKSLDARIRKLAEEVGEVATEAACLAGEKDRKGRSFQQVKDALKLEAVDVMLMAMDLLEYEGATDEEVNAIMARQLKKWREGQKNP